MTNNERLGQDSLSARWLSLENPLNAIESLSFLVNYYSDHTYTFDNNHIKYLIQYIQPEMINNLQCLQLASNLLVKLISQSEQVASYLLQHDIVSTLQQVIPHGGTLNILTLFVALKEPLAQYILQSDMITTITNMASRENELAHQARGCIAAILCHANLLPESSVIFESILNLLIESNDQNTIFDSCAIVALCCNGRMLYATSLLSAPYLGNLLTLAQKPTHFLPIIKLYSNILNTTEQSLNSLIDGSLLQTQIDDTSRFELLSFTISSLASVSIESRMLVIQLIAFSIWELPSVQYCFESSLHDSLFQILQSPESNTEYQWVIAALCRLFLFGDANTRQLLVAQMDFISLLQSNLSVLQAPVAPFAYDVLSELIIQASLNGDVDWADQFVNDVDVVDGIDALAKVYPRAASLLDRCDVINQNGLY